MLQRTEEIHQALNEVLEELRALPPGVLILVEGDRDRSSLRRIGIETPIECIHSSRQLPEIVSEFDEVVVLTDYDQHGRYLAKRAEAVARSFGVKPNLDFRRRIRRATYREVSHIEGLDTYLRNLARRASIR